MILRNTNLVVENLYYLLWLKDSGLKDASFSVKIPDTVIIQSGKIMNWFFSSKNGEGVLMKKEVNLKSSLIQDSFLRKGSRSGIVASFIQNLKNEDAEAEASKTFLTSNLLREESKLKFDIPKNEGDITVHYLTKEKLKEFLFTDAANNKTGILQAFIDPYSDSQAIIQAIWSPQLCVFSKRVNNRHLFDKRYDPFERATTFDGAEVYSRTVPLRGKMISQEMRKFCENIVHRISHVTFQKIMIQRMVVYFKMDEHNNINFLYCSSMRLSGEKIDPDIIKTLKHKIQNTPLIIDTNYIRPEEIKLIYTTNTMRPVSLENDIKCFHCQERIQAKDLVPVTYEFIINNFEENPNEQYSKVSNIPVIEAQTQQDFILQRPIDKFVKDKSSEIPQLIAKLYPKLNVENYRKFRTNRKFLSQKIKLCQYCFLDFSRYVKMSGAPLKGEQDFKFMKKGLSKRGSLFTREMKAIIAAKNVEMTEQKGSEFVRTQDREVYQRMLLHLVEEMQRIERESNRNKPNFQLETFQEKEIEYADNKNSNEKSIETNLSTRAQSAATKKSLSRPQSSLPFDPSSKLKAIHKEIASFVDKVDHQKQIQPLDNDNQLKQKPQQTTGYIDQAYFNVNYLAQPDMDELPELIEESDIEIEENHSKQYRNQRNSDHLERQYRINENFIKTKKLQLNLQNTSGSMSTSLQQKRPLSNSNSSTTIPTKHHLQSSTTSSNLNFFPSSTKASNQNNRPLSGPQFYPSSASSSKQHNTDGPLKPALKKSNSSLSQPHFQLNPIQRRGMNQNYISNSNSMQLFQKDTNNNGDNQLSSPQRQKVQFSSLVRPQSHTVSSSKPLDFEHKHDRIKTDNDNSNNWKRGSFQDKNLQQSQQPIQELFIEDEPIEPTGNVEEQQLDSVDQDMWYSIDFNMEEVNDDYLNQRD